MAAFNPSIEALIAQATEKEDQTVVQEFKREIPPAGFSVARCVSYIELGMQEQRSKTYGAKPPCEEVLIEFELLSPKYIKEYDEKDGTKTKHGTRITVQLRKLFNEKADFKKLFNAMDYGRGIKHMARFVGHAFLVEVVHATVGEGDKQKVYANLYKGKDQKTWTVNPPVVQKFNELGEPVGQQKLQVPAPTFPLRVFFFNMPTPETWDALFIEGEYEGKDAQGNAVRKSKNWIQSKILKATNYSGSPLHQMRSAQGLEKTQAAMPNPDDTKELSPLDALGLNGDGDLGPAFPSEAGGMDDVPF